MATKPKVISENQMKTFSAQTSYDIVNAVRNAKANGTSYTGIDFSERIPECTKATLQEIGEIFMGDGEFANGFIKELVNRIGMTIINYRRFNNNLKALKQGRLDFGESIEEIAFGLIKGKCDYATNIADGVTDVFQITLPAVQSALHKINFQQKYPYSITRFELKKAFTSETSLGSFLEGAIASVYNSFEVDEQLAYKNLMAECAQNGFFYPIQVSMPEDETTGKAFVKLVKRYSNVLSLAMHTEYNKAGLPQFTSKDDLVIILSAEVDASTEVDVLAAAFQATAVDFVGSGKKILVDEFPLEGMVAIVCDRRLFQIYDNDFSMDTIYNPSNRVWNYFLHVWEVISASPFMNGIVFVTEDAGAVTQITVTPSGQTVQPGGTLQMNAEVTGTGIFGNGVAWSVSGSTLGTGTSISSSGLLTVAADATGTITVTATSTYTETINGSTTVTVGS